MEQHVHAPWKYPDPAPTTTSNPCTLWRVHAYAGCEWTGLHNQKNISYSPRQYWCLHLWSRSSPSSDMRRGEVVQRKEYWRTYSGTNRQQNSVWVIPRCTTPKHSVVPHLHRTRLRIRWPGMFSVRTCGYVCMCLFVKRTVHLNDSPHTCLHTTWRAMFPCQKLSIGVVVGPRMTSIQGGSSASRHPTCGWFLAQIQKKTLIKMHPTHFVTIDHLELQLHWAPAIHNTKELTVVEVRTPLL